VIQVEPGSFRDPEGRVFYANGEVRRVLSQAGLDDFEALVASGLLDDPRIVATERVDDPPPDLLAHDAVALLRHESIPFVSYPYEWTFSMLRDAALLQLDLLLSALEHDLMLKDASPYNVQFRGARPVFIDVGAFERLRPEELWVGYRQFSMLYLYPLLLQALKGIDFRTWLRGSIDGISPVEMRGLMCFRERFRRGLATSVFLHARLERGARAGAARRARASVGKPVIQANVRKMRKLVARLDWRPPEGIWTRYGEENTYTETDARRKEEFVRQVAALRSARLAWDLGANNGRYSRVVAEHAHYVVALDADRGPVELLYRDLRAAGDERILPLATSVTDPSPALGWRGRERRPLLERGRPDLVLALALVHHVSIAGNVPLREFVNWLAELGAPLVIEFPTRDDPMVQTLLAPKRAGLHPDYQLDVFERHLGECFDVRRREQLGSGTRALFYATPTA